MHARAMYRLVAQQIKGEQRLCLHPCLHEFLARPLAVHVRSAWWQLFGHTTVFHNSEQS